MAGERDDSLQSISVRLNGKNYSYWCYVMKNFLKGKKLWRYVSGVSIKPTDDKVKDYADLLDTWEADNSKIITWINNSVEHSIGTQLAKYDTAKQVWDHLAKLYTHSNFAQRYQLESDIRAVQQQDMTVQEFYTTLTGLWDQLALTEPLSLQSNSDYILHREEQRLVQFLMALRSDFEGIRGNILHRNPHPPVDDVVSELLAEETRLKTLAGKGILAVPNHSVLAVPSRSYSSNQNQNRSFQKRTNSDECNFCKQKGHWKAQCPKLLNQSPVSSQQQRNHKPPQHSNTAALVPEVALPLNPNMVAFADQFQKFLSTQAQSHQPPYAMSTTSSTGLSSSGPSGITASLWILDSGASNHMSPDSSVFSSTNQSSSPVSVITADGSPMPLSFIGSVCTPTLSLSDVYCIPSLKMNLASVGQLCDSGFSVHFSSTSCFVQDPQSKKLIGTGHRKGGLYVLDELKVPVVAASTPDLSSFCLNKDSSSFYLWHSRLGHVSAPRLKFLASKGCLGNLHAHDISDCSGCKLAKFTALPFNPSISFSTAPFQLIHSDVWGPAPVVTKGGSRYYVSFIDDYTRYCWVYFMKHRSEFFDIYMAFRALVRTQHDAVIRCFRADLGGEYTSNAFERLLLSDGTVHQSSCTDTPAQNGVAERKHRHIVETARSLLLSASVPSIFWGEAVLTAVHLINRIPTALTAGISPYERLFGSAPDYSSLRVFGSTCFVLRPEAERNKLSARSAACVFLGYGEGRKGYRCFDPVSNKFYVSRHVVFMEHISFFSIPFPSHTVTKADLIHIDPFSDDADDVLDSTVSSPNPSLLQPFPIHYSRRSNTPTDAPPSSATQEAPEVVDSAPPSAKRIRKSTHLPDFDYSCYSSSFTSFLSSIHNLCEPQSYTEAARDPLWQQAMDAELSALHRTGTWDLVMLPPGKKAIGSRWVYKIKTNSDGSVERYKARLVAKGFAQQYGMDYEETFAPVAKMTTIRALIAVASVRHWHISQLDVKNAFLNGDLKEEVYMIPPPGVAHSSGQVCRLKKALYGLKQAPRAWFEKFSLVVTSLGFSPSHHDSALFVKSTSTGRIILSLYVDDMIITGDDIDGIAALKIELARQFDMKDLGSLRYFLGIEVAFSPKGYLLSQSKYTADILQRARLSDTRTVDTPLELNARYAPTDGTPLPDPTLYRTIVGSLVYLTITRPDIAHAVHIVSQFVTAPTTVHWAAVVRILRYLRGTICQSLLFPSTSSLELSAYSDADWAGDSSDRKSITGFCVFLGDSLISWKSKKQQVVSRSSTEAEYRAMASTTNEIVWLRWLLADMGVTFSGPTPLYCDNKSAIQIAHNSVFHERTKHIEIDCHTTRQQLDRGTISLPFVTSSLQLADFFTKSQTVQRFRFFVGKLSMLRAAGS